MFLYNLFKLLYNFLLHCCTGVVSYGAMLVSRLLCYILWSAMMQHVAFHDTCCMQHAIISALVILLVCFLDVMIEIVDRL
jgi:hypothetical protein